MTNPGEKEKKLRRVRGQGSMFRKGTNRTWTIQYYREGFKERDGERVLDGEGRPIRTRVRVREATGFTNQRKAQDLLTERLAQVGRNEWFERERRPATIEDLFDALKKHYLANGCRSAESLGRRWKHLKGAFAGVPAANLTTDDITRYTLMRKQKEKAANATINRELATLRRALNLGRRSTPPKVRVVPYIHMLKEDNVRLTFVEDADFSRLAAQAQELWLRTFLELAYTYGWRKGELLGLRVRQVNLLTRTIRLDPGTTKNGEGREVAMTAKVAELLRQAISTKRPDDFVLTRGAKPVKDLRQAWQNLCVRAGLGDFFCSNCKLPVTKRKKCECGSRKRVYRGKIPHDLRRSAAKALRRAGVPESVIMATGGWKTPAMFRRYAIVSSADQRAAVEMLERARAEHVSPRSAPFSPKTPQPQAGSTEVM